jgi:hypothetical protein
MLVHCDGITYLCGFLDLREPDVFAFGSSWPVDLGIDGDCVFTIGKFIRVRPGGVWVRAVGALCIIVDSIIVGVARGIGILAKDGGFRFGDTIPIVVGIADDEAEEAARRGGAAWLGGRDVPADGGAVTGVGVDGAPASGRHIGAGLEDVIFSVNAGPGNSRGRTACDGGTDDSVGRSGIEWAGASGRFHGGRPAVAIIICGW